MILENIPFIFSASKIPMTILITFSWNDAAKAIQILRVQQWHLFMTHSPKIKKELSTLDVFIWKS